MILTLVRLDTDPTHGTFGTLKLSGKPLCWTLEPYLNGNTPNKSAIPAQIYPLAPYSSSRYGQTWEVTDVCGRDYILIHAGNTATDTEGCIIPGMSLGELGGLRAVTQSRLALSHILAALAGAPTHKLIIKEVF